MVIGIRKTKFGLMQASGKARLFVFPSGKVKKSVMTQEDKAQAYRLAEASGIDPELLERFHAKVRHTHRRINCVVVEVDASRKDEFKRALKKEGHRVEDTKAVHLCLKESVPLIDVPAVWESGLTGRGIRIGVIDTGVDIKHPDLKGAVIAHKDFTETGYYDDVGHGTHIAGTIAGKGKVYRGVAPGAKILAARALTQEGGTDDDILAGISWASYSGADIISLSLGSEGDPHDVLSEECNALMEEGIIVCIAAGNEGPGARTVSSPGCAEYPITVGAVDKKDKLTFYSSRGPVYDRKLKKTLTKPDILACGGGYKNSAGCPYKEGIIAAKSNDAPSDKCTVRESLNHTPVYYERMSGTSMATPHVAGVAALLLEFLRKQKDLPTDNLAFLVKDILKKTAANLKLPPNHQGSGRLNARNALQRLDNMW